MLLVIIGSKFFSGEISRISEPHVERPLCPFLPPSYGALSTSRCVVPAQQPVVPIPIYQEIQKKDRIVEIPMTIIKDKIFPKIWNQQVQYEVPKLDIKLNTKTIDLPKVEFTEKTIEIPVPVG